MVTVGLPFCVFKFFTGLVAIQTPWLADAGYLLVGVAVVDLAFNLLNLVSLFVKQRRVTEVCLADVVFRRLGATNDLGIAVDVFLSFALVAIAIGTGMMTRLPAWGVPIWSVAVVFNVLGAGVGRLFSALSRRS